MWADGDGGLSQSWSDQQQWSDGNSWADGDEGLTQSWGDDQQWSDGNKFMG